MTTTKALVKKILEHPHEHDWSYQGLGMLRLYLSDELRLHIWDPVSAVPHVSELHTHPWDMHSEIVAGRIVQRRYMLATGDGEPDDDLVPYMRQAIFCGAGGGLCGAPEQVYLYPGEPEAYDEGEWYTQTADEIHQSLPHAGTVTIVSRTFLEDPDHAFVFWPAGEKWVSAEPRPATDGEVSTFTRLALSRWFT